MALKKTQDGKVDKRTKEYKEMCANLAKARAAQSKSVSKVTKKTTGIKKTQDGKVDKRTKEGKAIHERMAKARAAQNSFANRLKRLFK